MDESRKEYFRKYYQENKEHIKARSKKEWRANYYSRHKQSLNQKNTQRYLEYRRKWLDWIHLRGLDVCSICGYHKSFNAIDFHHPDPTTKARNIASCFRAAFTPKNIEEVARDLSQVIPVCSNCHRELHSEEICSD